MTVWLEIGGKKRRVELPGGGPLHGALDGQMYGQMDGSMECLVDGRVVLATLE